MGIVPLFYVPTVQTQQIHNAPSKTSTGFNLRRLDVYDDTDPEVGYSDMYSVGCIVLIRLA